MVKCCARIVLGKVITRLDIYFMAVLGVSERVYFGSGVLAGVLNFCSKFWKMFLYRLNSQAGEECLNF